MRAIGLTCGIGSMLTGARMAGFQVLANIEWRKYYHHKDPEGRNTFTENYPGARFVYSIDDLTDEEREQLTQVELAMGHPECGNFSQLSSMNPSKVHDPADIPLFIELVQKLKPRFFVMDDLPKSFMAFPMRKYAERLPEYDLFPEWISNYHYGNVQKNRRRMFMIGALKSEGWVFVPGEDENELTVQDVIGDLLDREGEVPNHDPTALDEICQRAKHLETLGRDEEATYRQLRDYFLKQKPGKVMGYWSPAGVVKIKPGHARAYWDAHMHVMDGASVQVHPLRCTPLTVRERARLQGFPDDFVFYGTMLNERGEYNHEKNQPLVKQTGKAMPVQFCHYVAEQIAAHFTGVPFRPSGRRMVKPNSYVDQAKQWYCENVGYSAQQSACDNCWLYASCEIRHRKYGIGPPPQQHPLEFKEEKVPLGEFSEEPPRSPRFKDLDEAGYTIINTEEEND